MKLGVLVVYRFHEGMQPMFDIHLGRLRRHTQCPYRIYATGHKLAAAQWAHVAEAPEIDLHALDVPRHFGTRDEHSFSLGKLAEIAVTNGCTHLLTMHLDSFPIKDGWQDAFIGPLERGEAAVVSIVPNGYSAGLCWRVDFQNRHRPPMLVSEKDRKSDEFHAFKLEFPEYDHVETGLGVIFSSHRLGMGWNRIGTDQHRKIYGGVLFHQVGATFRTLGDVQPIADGMVPRLGWKLVRPAAKILPPRHYTALRSLFVDKDRHSRDGSVRSKTAENAALIADPDGYVERLEERYTGEIVSVGRPASRPAG